MRSRQGNPGRLICAFMLSGLAVWSLISGSMVGAAEEYPAKPIIINVPFAPGGSAGLSAQTFADIAIKYLPKKQPIMINFKPGAGTALAADYVLKQPPDGYNLYWYPVDLPDKLALEGDKIGFSVDDFSYIGNLVVTPLVLPFKKDSRFGKFEDFVEYAKKHPGELSFGSGGGIGSFGHLTGEIIQQRCGIKLNHVPFPGAAPAMTAVLGGHIDTAILSVGSLGAHIQAGGGLKVLAVLVNERSPDVPNVPTLSELGFKVDRGTWYGVGARKGTPQPIVSILGDVLKKTTNDPEFFDKLTKAGFMRRILTSDDMRRMAQDEFNIAKDIFTKLGLK